MAVMVLDSAEDLIMLYKLEDDVEQHFPYSRNEWIQWLVSQVSDKNMLIMGNVEDEEITSYIVAYNCVDPPTSEYVSIIYFWHDQDENVNLDLMDKMRMWARVAEAEKIQVATEFPGDFEEYGFRKTPEVIMEVVL